MDKQESEVDYDVRKIVDRLGVMVVGTTGDELICVCPLHEDNDPSLNINVRKKVARCWSATCGFAGSFEYFIKEVKLRGIKYKGAPIKAMPKTSSPVTDEKFNNLNLALGSNYLKKRGINSDSIMNWDMRNSGVTIVYPAINRKNKVKGYIQRFIFKIAGYPKYKYSAGFPRSEFLFGINRFKPSSDGRVIVVEGSLDCIMMHQRGFTNTVSTLGTEFSLLQVELLKQIGEKFYIFFDNDAAGMKAAPALSEQLIDSSYITDYSLYESGDPASCTVKEVKRIIKGMVPYLEFKNKNLDLSHVEIL